jgi:hypothetical protein
MKIWRPCNIIFYSEAFLEKEPKEHKTNSKIKKVL